jgi:hypothetical protein
LRFLTDVDARAWSAARGVAMGAHGKLSLTPHGLHSVKFHLPATVGQLTWLCRFISVSLAPRAECLMWVSEWGVWPNSENWHRYYKLRQSHHDFRLIAEAPGHLFLDFEEPDLVSFLQLTILFGWDVHVLPDLDYGRADSARAFVSHDEWIALSHRDPAIVKTWRAELEQAEYKVDEAAAS